MKKMIGILALMCVCVIACQPMFLTNQKNLHVPAGYKTCLSTSDCPETQYCGFKEVDSYAVCLWRKK